MIKGIENLKPNSNNNFFLIAGPCVVENEEITLRVASQVKMLSEKYNIPYIFKASYRKANRSNKNSFTGIGDEKALSILQKIRDGLKIPILTDIHLPEEAALASSYDVDVLQIPAFLCRQTDLLEAAGKTGKHINIKKGQFLSPDSMHFAAEKVAGTGNPNIMLTERGTQFGYSDLVVDFRSIPIMKSFGYPVIMDITHSLQQPNQPSGVTGGQPDMIPIIAKAAIAAGVDGIFIETHPDPENAKSDGANMLALDKMESLLRRLIEIRKAVL